MTEQEWLTSTDPFVMLGLLQEKATKRKLRLFAVGCCRRVQQYLDTSHSFAAILVAERFADQLAGFDELEQARTLVENNLYLEGGEPVYDPSFWACSQELGEEVSRCAFYALNGVPQGVEPNCSEARWNELRAKEANSQAGLIRDVFGNPFRQVEFDSHWLAWNDGTLVKVAISIYEERAFESFPILADALEEAGCTNADIMNHCRQPGEHVRGCWVVDLLLGKS